MSKLTMITYYFDAMEASDPDWPEFRTALSTETQQ